VLVPGTPYVENSQCRQMNDHWSLDKYYGAAVTCCVVWKMMDILAIVSLKFCQKKPPLLVILKFAVLPVS